MRIFIEILFTLAFFSALYAAIQAVTAIPAASKALASKIRERRWRKARQHVQEVYGRLNFFENEKSEKEI